LWHDRLRLIDHGAALYFHHDWSAAAGRSRDPFERIGSHVLLPLASRIADVDAALAATLTQDVIRGFVAAIPDAWLADAGGAARREDYISLLTARLAAPRPFVEEAVRARTR
jgi:hypothetical protein